MCIVANVNWVLCHVMTRSQVANGKDGLQIWRVASNILNKQLQIADTGWSSTLGPGCGAYLKNSLLRNVI
jgi:hypothetical protein